MKAAGYESLATFERSHFWYLGREDICFSILQEIDAGALGNILDYGCGTGNFMEKLERIYPAASVYGADISDIALNYCRKRGHQRLFDLKRESPPEHTFDLILCLDVLEHIENDEVFLKDLHIMLTSGGTALLTVPAYEFLWSGEDYVSNHVRRYTRGQIRNLLEDAGFRILKLSYFNTFLLAPMVFVLLWKRIFQPKSMYETDFKPVNPALNRLLARIFTSEKWFLKRMSFPFGASILGLAVRDG